MKINLLKKPIMKVCLFLLAFVGVERFCRMQTQGFELQKIFSDGDYKDDLEVPPLTADERTQIDKLLDQRFYFLGMGAQCYAFLGEDQTTVLKTFKHYHTPFSTKAIKALPLPHFLNEPRNTLVKKREHRLHSILKSCHIAYTDFKEQTGLLFAHLNPSSDLKKRLTIIDKLGIIHQIELDQVEFVLQKRAELVYKRLAQLVDSDDTIALKKSVDAFCDLILQRCKKGINWDDPIVYRNYGFVGHRPCLIDIGSFRYNASLKQPFIYKKQLFYETLEIKCWLEKHYPSLLPYFSQKMEDLLSDEV